MQSQAELFKSKVLPSGSIGGESASSAKPKLFHGANGVELPYWEENDKVIRVALSDDLLVDVTHQSGGRMYTTVPAYGRVQKRNKKSFLAALALIAQSLAINNSIESQLKQQRDLLRMAADEIGAPTKPAVGGRDRSAAKEFSQRAFGPIMETFDDVPEYPLGTPSWIARRCELEWSQKALYGQLRKWFGVVEPGCTVIASSSALGMQIGMDRRAIGRGLRHLEQLRLIHVEGPTTGKRRVYFHRHEWMADPSAVPTWAKLGQDNKASCPNLATPPVPIWAQSCAELEHKTSNTSKTGNTKRVLAPDGEQDLLDELQSLLGAQEMVNNGGMWRKRMRGGPLQVKALRNTIDDFKNRRSNHTNPIRHPAKWFTDRYHRALIEIDEAQRRTVASKPCIVQHTNSVS